MISRAVHFTIHLFSPNTVIPMFFDCHTHTLRSHDSNASAEALCRAALSAGLNGVMLTDHCDCEFSAEKDIPLQFRKGEEDYAAVRAAYEGRLNVRFGIELGDPLFASAFAREICQAFPFDAVLLSVHAVRAPGFTQPFSRIDFSCADDAFLRAYLHQYFTDVLCSVRQFDFDVLCHLTVPLRYIVLKYGKRADVAPYTELIAEILSELIKKDGALEINTSAAALPQGFLMPDAQIIELFLRLGGKHFTLGSDAHVPESVGAGFLQAAELLRSYDVKSLCFYEQRQRRTYSLGRQADGVTL